MTYSDKVGGPEAAGKSMAPSGGFSLNYSQEEYLRAKNGRNYFTRAVATNKAFNTGAPLFRSWAEAKTGIEYQDDNGDWETAGSPLYSDMYVKAVVRNKKRVGFKGCRTRSASKTGENFARAEQNRCDGNGAWSYHTAKVGTRYFYWPDGTAEDYHLP